MRLVYVDELSMRAIEPAHHFYTTHSRLKGMWLLCMCFMGHYSLGTGVLSPFLLSFSPECVFISGYPLLTFNDSVLICTSSFH